MSGLIELSALGTARPGPGATPEQTAAWYLAKGRTFERLARQAHTPTEQAADMTIAVGAYEHARRLLADASSGGRP